MNTQRHEEIDDDPRNVKETPKILLASFGVLMIVFGVLFIIQGRVNYRSVGAVVVGILIISYSIFKKQQ
jgi:hypothetical protein